MISEQILTAAVAQGREIVSVFLATGGCAVYHVEPRDAAAIHYHAGGLVTVERHDGGVVMLPAEHCGFEFGPPKAAS